jgi:diguanylate cyclase (GGDEF)-like protein
MNKPIVDMLQLPPAQLQVLLTFSRDLFQSDDLPSAARLVGQTLAEVVHPAEALLLTGGTQPVSMGFASDGSGYPAGTNHALYHAAMHQLSAPPGICAVSRPGDRQCLAGRAMLAVALPARAPIATLVVAWENEQSAEGLDQYARALEVILELAAAALGKIETHDTLARLVHAQRENIASTSITHTAQLAQRDKAASEMRTLSLTDVLTGLYNRRGFFLQAEQIFRLAQRQRGKSAVIFADIDGLKLVNDELGHAAGDRMIQDTGHILHQSFRHADVVARLGGDEFVAYTLDDEQPGVILERIRANLHAFNLMQDRPYTVSISAGVVQCDPGGAQTLSHYVTLADERMYALKRRRLH